MIADRSHTEYTRRKRATAQAVRRAVCPTCPEQGPNRITDKETQLSRLFGQQTYFRPRPNGMIDVISCCTSTCAYVSACGSFLFNLTFTGSQTIPRSPQSCNSFTASAASGTLFLTFANGIEVGCIILNDGDTYPSTNGITGLSSASFETSLSCLTPPSEPNKPGPTFIPVSASGSGTFDASLPAYFDNIAGLSEVWVTICYDASTITVNIPADSQPRVDVRGTGLGSYVFSATP